MAQGALLRGGLRQRRHERPDRRPERSGAEQYHPRPTRSRPGPGSVRGRLRPQRLGHSRSRLQRQDEGRRRFARRQVRAWRGRADLDHRLPLLQGRPGRRLRLRHGGHPLPARRRDLVAQVPDAEPGDPAQRHRLQRQARLARRRLLRR